MAEGDNGQGSQQAYWIICRPGTGKGYCLAVKEKDVVLDKPADLSHAENRQLWYLKQTAAGDKKPFVIQSKAEGRLCDLVISSQNNNTVQLGSPGVKGESWIKSSAEAASSAGGDGVYVIQQAGEGNGRYLVGEITSKQDGPKVALHKTCSVSTWSRWEIVPWEAHEEIDTGSVITRSHGKSNHQSWMPGASAGRSQPDRKGERGGDGAPSVITQRNKTEDNSTDVRITSKMNDRVGGKKTS